MWGPSEVPHYYLEELSDTWKLRNSFASGHYEYVEQKARPDARPEGT